jgi:hypothetical protein
MKKIILAAILILGLLGGYAVARLTPDFFKKAPTGVTQLVGRLGLFKEYPDGFLRDAGVSVPYDITGTHPDTSLILLSPDKTKVVYTVWENAHIVIYVAGVDGTGVKKIAEQDVPEGSGALDVNSIRWSDEGSRITYNEDGLKCMKKSCLEPNDFTDVTVSHSVDINTGNQSVVNVNGVK